MDFEVEQKYRLDDWSQVQQKLSRMGVSFEQPVVQIDQYFNHPSRDFSQTDEALRIRRVGSQCYVTYKGPKIDRDSKTRQEIEVALADGEQGAAKSERLFRALGFGTVATVRKTRRRAFLQWEGQKGEIALDDVHELGCFIELDFVAPVDQLSQAHNSLLSLARHLGLSNDERRSYLELLLERKTH